MQRGGSVKSPQASAGVIVLLAGIGALGSMAIHAIVPVLPSIATDLQAGQGEVQLAVSLYLAGLGAGQLLAGPLADRYGRRPVLLAGIVVFALAAAGAGAASGAEVLLAARMAQAVGAALCLVAVRAVVADIAPKGDTAGQLAILTTVLLVSPALAPLAGGTVAAGAGWRAIFLLLAGLGAAGAVVCWAVVGETLTPSPAARPASPLEGWARLMRNGRFLRYALAIGCASTSMYVFLSGSGFLLAHEYGLAPHEAGVCYFLIALGGIGGSLLVRRLEARGGAFRLGLFSAVAGGAGLLGCALMDIGGLAGVIGPMMLVGVGAGIAAPSGMAGVMAAEKGYSGTAASLAGAMQMLASGATSSLLSLFAPPSHVTLGAGVLAAALLGALLAPRGPAVRPES